MELTNASGDCSSCYLEGEYYDSVLSSFGVPHHTKPIILHLEHNRNGDVSSYEFQVDGSEPTDQILPTYVRLVIQSNLIRHSTLLIIIGNDVLWWNPRQHHPTEFLQRLHAEIKTIIRDYISRSGLKHLQDINLKVPSITKCGKGKSGFCTAYVLKYALCHFFGLDFDTGTITGFTREVENSYPSPSYSDIEYDFSPGGMATGVLGGGLIGGALAGGPGLLAGATAGALVSGIFSKNDQTSKWIPQYTTRMHSKFD